MREARPVTAGVAPSTIDIHNWGTTAAEQARSFPCDRLLPEHNAAYFRGVLIDAPAATVFAWLCQLRAGTYSYDWVSHPGRRSPRVLDPALRHIAVGQSVMSIFDLAAFERDRHLTLRLRRPGLYPPLAVSYMIVPIAPYRCRLLTKLVLQFRSTVFDRVSRWVAPWLDGFMTRRQLLNLKALSEATAPHSNMA